MKNQRFDSVWDAIEDTPQEAANMKVRALMIMEIKDRLGSVNQAAAAKLLGVTQPRVSDLMRGKIDLFSIDTLVNILVALTGKIPPGRPPRTLGEFFVRAIAPPPNRVQARTAPPVVGRKESRANKNPPKRGGVVG